MWQVGGLKSFRVLGDDSVLHLLSRVGRYPRIYPNLVKAGFPDGQLNEARADFFRTAATPVACQAARRMAHGYFDDEELLQLFCRYYECTDWRLESSPLFYAPQDYENFFEALLSPIEFEIGLLAEGVGERKWGDYFVKYPFDLAMRHARTALWQDVCRKDHYWKRLSTYADLRADKLFQYLTHHIDVNHFSRDVFFYHWEREFRRRLHDALQGFHQALEEAVRRWQEARHQERARFQYGAYPATGEALAIEAREAMAYLGLDLRHASIRKVRSRFRQLSKTHHPDQGGNANSFRHLSRCREIAEAWVRRHRPD